MSVADCSYSWRPLVGGRPPAPASSTHSFSWAPSLYAFIFFIAQTHQMTEPSSLGERRSAPCRWLLGVAKDVPLSEQLPQVRTDHRPTLWLGTGPAIAGERVGEKTRQRESLNPATLHGLARRACARCPTTRRSRHPVHPVRTRARASHSPLPLPLARPPLHAAQTWQTGFVGRGSAGNFLAPFCARHPVTLGRGDADKSRPTPSRLLCVGGLRRSAPEVRVRPGIYKYRCTRALACSCAGHSHGPRASGLALGTHPAAHARCGFTNRHPARGRRQASGQGLA